MGACSRYRLFLMADIWRKPYSEEKQSFFELHFSMKVDHSCGESHIELLMEASGLMAWANGYMQKKVSVIPM